MASKKWSDIRRRIGDPAREARVASMVKAMNDVVALADLRESRGLTQHDVAERLGIYQPNISRLERRDDLYLSTLREYVSALGGELDLVARFENGEEVRIQPSREPVEVA